MGYAKIGVNELYIKNFDNVFSLKDNVAFVYALYTNPKYRNQKFGSFLVCETMNFLNNEGVHKLACHIRSSNIPSISLFKRLGFKPTGSLWQFKFFKIWQS